MYENYSKNRIMHSYEKRIQCIMLTNEKKQQQEIHRMTGIPRRSQYNIKKEYEGKMEKIIQKLQHCKKTQRKSKLTKIETIQCCEEFIYANPFATRKDISIYMKHNHNVYLSQNSIGKLLKRQQFSRKKSKKIMIKQLSHIEE